VRKVLLVVLDLVDLPDQLAVLEGSVQLVHMDQVVLLVQLEKWDLPVLRDHAVQKAL
jgi:hypothetical protein